MLRDVSDQAVPNPAHLALAKHGVPVVTMNVDGLHFRGGSTDCIEIHGNLREVSCPSCRHVYDFKQVYQSIHCPKCEKVLQPDVVLYGDRVPQYAKAVDKVCSAQHLLVVGTSFYTSTAHMALMAKNQGIPTTIINEDAERRVAEWLDQQQIRS
jgi:NAD-dependent deacetylase